MSASLLLLIRMQFYGMWRKFVRGLQSPRKAIFSIVALLWMMLAFGPTLWRSLQTQQARPEYLDIFVPLFLLLICTASLFSSAAQKAIQFQPCEVDLLFSAPYSRRELLTYKILNALFRSIFTALLISIFILQYSRNWPMAFLGAYTVVMFIQLFSMFLVLLKLTLSHRIHRSIQKLFALLLGGLVGYALWNMVPWPLRPPTWAEVQSFFQSPPVRIALMPFLVFSNIMAADKLIPDFLFWFSIGMMMNLVTYALILKLDANYIETAMDISRRLYERQQQFKKGGVLFRLEKSRTRHWRVPLFPWLAGAGPNLWRHCTALARNLGGSAFVALMIVLAIGAGPIFSLFSRGNEALPVLVGILCYMSLLLSIHFRFDFRGDLDHIAFLKTLPLDSMMIAFGELFVPVAFMTTLHALALLSFTYFTGGLWLLALAIVAATFPFNLILLGVQNFIFLLFPYDITPATPGDVQHFGRQMLIFLLMLILLMLFGGVAALFGWLAYWATGWQWETFATVTALTLFLQSLLVFPMVAWAYRRFDVSMDMP